MPVLVSLQKLVQVPETKPLWPDALRSFSHTLEKDPTNRTTWAVLADWLDESDQNEPSLARACRIISKRKDVQITGTKYSTSTSWSVRRLPTICGGDVSGWDSLLWCAGMIADNIDAAFAELEKSTEAPEEEPEEVATLPEPPPFNQVGYPEQTPHPHQTSNP
jgi:uncharacterized protein (TIGR02996 family)